MVTDDPCPLCAPSNEQVLMCNATLRIILADEPASPGFVRVVLNAHIAELTDLPVERRRVVMDAVCAAESARRRTLRPDKINLASLGNYVAHVHWHVIPRYRDDAGWPDAVWAVANRVPPPRAVDIALLTEALQETLGASEAAR